MKTMHVACGVVVMLAMTARGRAETPGQEAEGIARRCDGGEATSCEQLAESYEWGDSGLRADLGKAYALRRQACRGGAARACRKAAEMARDGRGVARDAAAALADGRAACAGGDAEGCTVAIALLERGRGVTRSPLDVLALEKAACALRSGPDCAKAGAAVRAGFGALPDEDGARRLFERGCRFESAAACRAVGRAPGDYRRLAVTAAALMRAGNGVVVQAAPGSELPAVGEDVYVERVVAGGSLRYSLAWVRVVAVEGLTITVTIEEALAEAVTDGVEEDLWPPGASLVLGWRALAP